MYNKLHKLLDKDMEFMYACGPSLYYKDELSMKLCYLSYRVLELYLYDDMLALYYGRILYNTLLDMYKRDWHHPDGEEYKDTIIINHLLDSCGLIEWGTSIRTPWLLTYEDHDIIDNYNGFKLKLTEENVESLLKWINPDLTRLPYKSFREHEEEV